FFFPSGRRHPRISRDWSSDVGSSDLAQQHWLRMYKLGDGPIYTFYTPYHLCHLEVPFTIARAALFGDAVVAPEAGHVVDVVTCEVGRASCRERGAGQAGGGGSRRA